MYVAIGQFNLAKPSKLFKFLRLSKRIQQQALDSKGNVGVELSGGSLKKFYVISQWSSMEDMRAFTHTGVHMEAIKLSKEMAAEIRLLYFETEAAPSMKEGIKMLQTDERVRVF